MMSGANGDSSSGADKGGGGAGAIRYNCAKSVCYRNRMDVCKSSETTERLS